MPRLHRITALITSILLAHVSWLGSGLACGTGAMADGMSAMTAAADAPSTQMAAMAGVHDVAAPSDTAPDQDRAPCSLPWAPGACQSLVSPCAPLALASRGNLLQATVGTPATVTRIALLTPPSQVRAPEIPPPRA